MMSHNYIADSGKRYIWNGQVCTNDRDASSIWFGLDTLKKFIWMIENLNCMNQCHDSLGIRFYYARYPDTATMRGTYDLASLNLNYANKHTLFGIPTFRLGGVNIDFNPLTGCRGAFDSTKPSSPNYLLFSLMGLPGSDGQNHGGLAPPPDEEGTFDF
jgi:hypothetical protein